jgi:hypothetical protein
MTRHGVQHPLIFSRESIATAVVEIKLCEPTWWRNRQTERVVR